MYSNNYEGCGAWLDGRNGTERQTYREVRRDSS